MLTMAFIRSIATVPAVMTVKVVGEDEAGETTGAVIVAATTKVEVDVDEDAAVEMRCGVDRDPRSPRKFIAARGLVDYRAVSSRDLTATNDCSPITLMGYSRLDPIISLYTRFLSYCQSAAPGMRSHVGKSIGACETIDSCWASHHFRSGKGRAFKLASTSHDF